MFKKKIKIILSLFFLVLFSLSFVPFIVEGANPVFNNNTKDLKTLTFSKTDNPFVYENSTSLLSGDNVYFVVYYHNNTIGTTATNTKIRITYPCDARNQIVSTARISADNASSVSDTGTINVSNKKQKLVFENTARWYPNQTKTATNISVTQVGSCAVEVNIGNIQGCWEYQGNVIFEATLIDDDDDDDADGELSCYRSTDDSITLSYSTENASNASIFRSSSRLTNLGSGDKSGTYKDTGLSSDRSYTYYLRNGTSTSSTELDRVTCSTDDDDDDDADGYLSCYSSTDDSIRLEYDFEDGDDVSLFRGNTRIETWTSSDDSGKITDDDLDEDTSYTYYLRNGRSSSSTQLDRVTCSTDDDDDDDDDVWGDLECYSSTDDSIRLEYDFENGDDVSLFRGDRRIETWTSSDDSGKITDDDLDEDTSYVYYLRNGRYSSSTRLSRVTCSTGDESGDEELLIEKKVQSRDRYTSFYTALIASPGERISYSIKISAKDNDAEDVVVKDTLPDRVSYEGNLKVDGRTVFGNIESGINIGDIEEGDYKTITFDAVISPRNSFYSGTASLVNTVRVTSEGTTATGSATIYVTVSTPTVVPTGITGNKFFDYVLIPLLLTILLFALFRRQFVALVKKIELAGREARENW